MSANALPSGTPLADDAISSSTTSPIVSLIDGFTSIFVAIFNLIRILLSFATVTIPSACFSILHYSLTLQLNFPALFILFLAAVVSVLFWLRYKHRSYERLKEVPLKTDDGFNLHPDIHSSAPDEKQGPFHTYLDEFLQAIRIFGFLEKPVFHELARHLQTRRLLAGESLSLDSDFSFYIVMDGHVQVFAPLPRQGTNSPESFDDDEDDNDNNGFQLLNEVESGGTLSSLFTILSLFTEEVHLGMGEQQSPQGELLTPSQGHSVPRSEPRSPTLSRTRTSSHISGLTRRQQRTGRGTDDSEATVTYDSEGSPTALRSPASLALDHPSESPEAQFGHSHERGLSPGPADLLPPPQVSAPHSLFGTLSNSHSSSPRRGSASPAPSYHRRRSSYGRPGTPGSVLSGMSRHTSRGPATLHGGGKPSDTLHYEGVGTVGRATVDTTLAVIPAEAFKRLTKKYPNSAAHIVQVILTRLSRVTFQTAHKYLGLTKEVMRTEKRLNELACFPLPSSFYEQGGIEKLRQRFLPEPRKQQNSSTTQHDERDDDYFRGMSGHKTPVPGRKGSIESNAKSKPPTTPWGHSDPPLKTPTARSMVGPGDLFSMTGTQEDHQRPNAVNPISKDFALSPRQSGERVPRVLSPEGTASSGNRTSIHQLDDDWRNMSIGPLGDFDLKDEILSCLSKALGLQASQQPTPPFGEYEASPFLNPQDAALHRSVFNSAFGSLSMLDGMMFEDETSSITGASSLAGQYHADLENEVEVKFYPAGSLLCKAGESHTGLFYIIDGFVDIFIPPEQAADVSANQQTSHQKTSTKKRAEQKRGPAATMAEFGSGQGRSNDKSSSSTRNTKTGTATELRSPFADSQSNIGYQTMSSSRSTSNSTQIGNALDGTRSSLPSRAPKGSGSTNPARDRHNEQIPSGDTRDQAKGPAPASSARPIYTVGRGGVAGYLSSLFGTASYVDIRAKTDVYVGYLPARALERIMERRPISLLTLSKRLLSLLSPLVIHIDSALDWQHVNAGQVIFREDDPSDSFYIVINGRLRAISERDGTVDILNEYGQGESVGELDVITSSPRRKTLHAIRDSELARMPMTLFNAVAIRHPQITIQISRIIARRVRQELESRQAAAHISKVQVPGLPDLGRNNANLKTVAILPVTREVPITEFANKLQTAFEDTIGGPAAFLNQSSVMSVLGRHAFNRMGKLKLAGWLAEQEQKYRLVLYVVDTAVSSPWAQTSIRQADTVLLVGFGDDPSVGEYERLLSGVKTTARKELVLLHPERSVPPGSTREWLKSRPWINAHHHVEMPGITRSHAAPMTSDPTAVKALKSLKERLETSLQRYRVKGSGTAAAGRPHHFNDFARLARRLCGKSIGLVLGGGGARGCAHVGVIQALEERGVPIDMIGGTSIGSLIGGLYAKEGEVVSSYGRAKKFAGRIASLWRFASDVTYPVVSYTTGHEFNRGIFKALGDTHIEDMWLPFFCNTTNITWSRMEVHTTGYAWRFIRGSMTLAGLLPPLVEEGNMLVDGGYMDNLPVSVMIAMGARDIFAVDVGSIDDTSPRSYGDTLSGWWVLLNKWNPWSDARNIPSIPEIQARLTYVSSVTSLEEAKRIPGCLYMRLPTVGFGTLEFSKFQDISRIGYAAGSKMLDDWAAQGKLPTGMEPSAKDAVEDKRRRGGISARRNSV
ncbi:unnamed protein product [Sympodiomycopsis kandeliae]